MLSELPTDAEHRDGILDQSGERARPEQRRSFTKKQRKAETAAALMAAYIGQALSKTQNVTIGVATDVDENHLFEKARPARPIQGTSADDKKPKAAKVDDANATDLVPWIRLDHKTESAPTAPDVPATDH